MEKFAQICCLLCQALMFLTPLRSPAQADLVLYKGLRVSVFNCEIQKQSADALSLRCTMANTGRYAVHISSQNKQTYSATLNIETDSVGMPPALAGHAFALRKAFLNTHLQLEPGEVREAVSLKVDLASQKTRENALPANSKNCPDLCFDTAYVVQRNAKNLVLHYTIRNRGSAAAPLAGRKAVRTDNAALNFYFISGDRITRGAVLADGIFLRPKRANGKNLLQPDERLEGEVEISLENRTRFSPNLALEIDPFLAVAECERANNVLVIQLE